MTAAATDEAASILALRRRFFDDHRANIENGRFHVDDVRRVRTQDWFVRKFVHRCDGDLDVALPMLAEALKWRQDFRVDALTPQSFGDYFAKGVLYIHGSNKDGHALLWFRSKLHKKDASVVDAKEMPSRRLLVYWLEKHSVETHGEPLVIIFDMSGAGLQNMDLDLIRFLLHTLKFCYPELLAYLVVYDIPWVLNAAWKVVKTWLDAEAQKRIIFTNLSGIQEYIPSASLPVHMGGVDKFQFDATAEDRESSPLATGATMFLEVARLVEESSVYSHDANGSPEMARKKSVKFTDGHDEMDATNEQSLGVVGPSSGVVRSASDLDSVRKPSTNELAASVGKMKSSVSHQGMSSSTAHEVTSRTPLFSSSSRALSSKAREMIDARVANMEPAWHGPKLTMSPREELVFETLPGESECVDVIVFKHENAADAARACAFKIKTTSPEKFRVKPSVGFVKPGESAFVKIYLQAGYQPTCHKDKFLIVCAPCANADPPANELSEFWKSADKQTFVEHRLRCRLADGILASSASSSNSDGYPKGSAQLNGSIHHAGDGGDSGTQDVRELARNMRRLQADVERLRADYQLIRNVLFVVVCGLFVVVMLSLLPFRAAPAAGDVVGAVGSCQRGDVCFKE